jgi:hypothetical protein
VWKDEPKLSPECQPQTSIGRTSVGVYAEPISLLHDGIPCPVVGFQVNLRNHGNLGQHPGPELIDYLLNAAGFK